MNKQQLEQIEQNSDCEFSVYYVTHEGDCYTVYASYIVKLDLENHEVIKAFDTLNKAIEYAKHYNQTHFGGVPTRVITRLK